MSFSMPRTYEEATELVTQIGNGEHGIQRARMLEENGEAADILRSAERALIMDAASYDQSASLTPIHAAMARDIVDLFSGVSVDRLKPVPKVEAV